MNKVPDRAKMRRDYLGSKFSAKTQQAVGFVVLLVCGLVTGLIALCLLATLVLAVFRGVTDRVGETWVLLFAGLLIFGFMSWLGFSIIREAHEKEQNLPYVAPVRHQIPTLPAEEVLLRGSQSSASASQELVRPAAVEPQSPQEELLRPAADQESFHVKSDEAQACANRD